MLMRRCHWEGWIVVAVLRVDGLTTTVLILGRHSHAISRHFTPPNGARHFYWKIAPSGLPKMAWWSEEMAWMARMERMEREWCLQRSTLILKQTISAYRMMFVDYRTVSRWIVSLDDGCQIQWNTTIFGLFWVNHEEPLLSWMHERPDVQLRSSYGGHEAVLFRIAMCDVATVEDCWLYYAGHSHFYFF